MGSAEIKDQSFVVIPLQYTIIERGKEAPLAGILGLEIFERFALSLDYHGKTLRLRPSQGFHYDGPEPKYQSDFPMISPRSRRWQTLRTVFLLSTVATPVLWSFTPSLAIAPGWLRN